MREASCVADVPVYVDRFGWGGNAAGAPDGDAGGGGVVRAEAGDEPEVGFGEFGGIDGVGQEEEALLLRFADSSGALEGGAYWIGAEVKVP